jgi:hypothetical protein
MWLRQLPKSAFLVQPWKKAKKSKNNAYLKRRENKNGEKKNNFFEFVNCRARKKTKRFFSKKIGTKK